MTRTPKKEKHLELYHFIVAFQGDHGYTPSYEEIIDKTEIKSKSHITYLLDKLEGERLLERTRGQARSIRLTAPQGGLVRVPLIGQVSAGQPIYLPDQANKILQPIEVFDFPSASLPHLPPGSEVFAMRVSGDSMVDAAILDGDIVILARPQDGAQIKKNAIVAAWLVSEETTTIKRYVPQPDGKVWLVPENPDHEKYKPLVIDDPAAELEIHGILVSVMRSY